jgi:hypothetical protein
VVRHQHARPRPGAVRMHDVAADLVRASNEGTVTNAVF